MAIVTVVRLARALGVPAIHRDGSTVMPPGESVVIRGVLQTASVDMSTRTVGGWSLADATAQVLELGRPLSVAADGDGYLVLYRLPSGEVIRRDVDEPTALLALLAYARGLEVDLGPCPACGGAMIETLREGFRYVSLAAKRSGGLRRDGWESKRSGSDADGFVVEARRPCQACYVDGQPERETIENVRGEARAAAITADLRREGWTVRREMVSSDVVYRLHCERRSPGQPTGRDVRPLVRVLLDSMPQGGEFISTRPETPVENGGLVYVRIRGPGEVGAFRSDADNGRAVEMKSARFEVRGSYVGIRSLVPGDPASRIALAVKADELAQAGDPLARPLAAFLGGECRTCEGAGLVPCPGRCAGIMGRDCIPCGATSTPGRVKCRTCHGHGTMLGALAPTLEEMAAEEDCNGEGRIVP